METKTFKQVTISCVAALALFSAVAPSATALADMSPVSQKTTVSNQSDMISGEIQVTNADILNYIKKNDPIGYSHIPKSTIDELLHADLLKKGTTKMTFSGSGFKIYLDSTTANWAKNAGSVAIAGLFGALGTAAGTPLVGGITAAAGAALGIAIGGWNVSNGVWISYNWLGFMTGHGSQ